MNVPSEHDPVTYDNALNQLTLFESERVLTLTSLQVCALAGISYRQLDYWTTTGKIPTDPDLRAPGSGYQREWSFRQAVHIALVNWLNASGLSLDAAVAAAGRVIESLPQGALRAEIPLVPPGVPLKMTLDIDVEEMIRNLAMRAEDILTLKQARQQRPLLWQKAIEEESQN